MSSDKPDLLAKTPGKFPRLPQTSPAVDSLVARLGKGPMRYLAAWLLPSVNTSCLRSSLTQTSGCARGVPSATGSIRLARCQSRTSERMPCLPHLGGPDRGTLVDLKAQIISRSSASSSKMGWPPTEDDNPSLKGVAAKGRGQRPAGRAGLGRRVRQVYTTVARKKKERRAFSTLHCATMLPVAMPKPCPSRPTPLLARLP